MYETRLDTNVHFPVKQDGPPLTWESFRSGFPMVLYQNKENELLNVNESQGAERRVYQISSSSKDPFHYTSQKNETGFLTIAPKQSDALRSIIPANVMPSITPQTLETPTKMYQTRLDTNVHFPKKQDCLPLNWGSFPSGFPMMDYGPIYTCNNNNTIFQPQSDLQEDKQLVITGKQTSRWDLKSKKPCNCTKSKCLKLYCDCFANSEFCNNCNCNKCCNNLDNKEKCFKAIRAKIMCSSNCKCIRCKNVEECPDRKTPRSIQKQQDAERFYSVFTSPDVVRAAATCLLAQAEKVEEENQSVGIAEKMIIEEFGNCLSQMLQTDIQRYQ
ncbi:protein lin-54 homolog [Rana temporaria]|uniref:protein lin-54 homolog n=1 Tax=Rana temporaria TaxID=8407 RepID=UPI001AADBA47|nr:protein lin-54 homolog [Rana temporaria]